MEKVMCVICAKKKDMKGGKVCEEGHFICAKHIYSWVPGPSRKTCPLDGTKLK
jgi:hypothetical protein